MKTVLETEDGRTWMVRVIGTDGQPVQEHRTITVGELCRGIGRSRRQVYRYFHLGIIKPVGKYLGEWLVDEQAASAWAPTSGRRAARIPRSSRALFPEFDLETMHAGRHAGIVMHRLLEEGDRDELRWLFSSYGRAAVATWVRRDGWRLAPRTARFWGWWLRVRPASRRPVGGSTVRTGIAAGMGEGRAGRIEARAGEAGA